MSELYKKQVTELYLKKNGLVSVKETEDHRWEVYIEGHCKGSGSTLNIALNNFKANLSRMRAQTERNIAENKAIHKRNTNNLRFLNKIVQEVEGFKPE